MLKQRVITGLIVGGVFIGALFLLPMNVFLIFTGMVFLAGAWEWSLISGLKNPVLRVIYLAAFTLIMVSLGWLSEWGASAGVMQTLLIVAVSWWAFSVIWVQGYPSSRILWAYPPVKMIMGFLTIAPAWLATLFLLNQPHGALLVLSVVLLVAGADVGAYFAGKQFGRTKLAAQVSPGKSWEGVCGGLLLSILVGVTIQVSTGLFTWTLLLVLIIPTVFFSVVGDLVESMVKRDSGVKDSGSILPGHGGVLDRIDGLVAAAPTFALIYLSSTNLTF